MATSATKLAPKAIPKAGASADGTAAAPKSRMKLFIIVAIVAVVLAAGAAGGAWYFLSHGAAQTGEKKPEPAKAPIFTVLEPFTVNLQPETGEQFLQVAMTLQVADQSQVDLIKLYMPMVRGRLVVLLSSKKGSEISTAEGKKKLADEIIAQIRQPFTTNGASPNITSVFFTSFVIQ